MTSGNAARAAKDGPESTSDNTAPVSGSRRRGRARTELPTALEEIHLGYVAQLKTAPVDDDTRRAYASRVLGLLPFYAGLRIGEAVALDVADVSLSARKGHVVVRSGKGSRYREIPLHPELREQLGIWINDERPVWPGAVTNPALFLNARGGRLGVRGASDILARLADDAGIDAEDFTSHVLRHTFGTTLVRGGHDLVRGAQLMGHRRLWTTPGHA